MQFFKLLCLSALLLSACTNTPSTNQTPQPAPVTPPVVGADQDEHGCKGSAGYTWSVVKNECIQIFNAGIRLNPKAANLDQTLSAFVVFKSDTEDAQAEVYLPGESKSRLFDKVADNGAGTWKNDTFLLTQWKGMYTLQGGKKQVLYEGAAAR